MAAVGQARCGFVEVGAVVAPRALEGGRSAGVVRLPSKTAPFLVKGLRSGKKSVEGSRRRCVVSQAVSVETETGLELNIADDVTQVDDHFLEWKVEWGLGCNFCYLLSWGELVVFAFVGGRSMTLFQTPSGT